MNFHLLEIRKPVSPPHLAAEQYSKKNNMLSCIQVSLRASECIICDCLAKKKIKLTLMVVTDSRKKGLVRWPVIGFAQVDLPVCTRMRS